MALPLLLAALTSFLAATPAASPVATPAAAVESRRDPFAPPEAALSDPKLGLKGMAWQHLRCAAVAKGPGGLVATLASGEVTFFVREGDRLRNAVVTKVDPERRGVLLREPAPGTVAGFREVILLVGEAEAIVREPRAAEPLLPVSR